MKRRHSRSGFWMAAIGLLAAGGAAACTRRPVGATPGQPSGTGGVGGQNATGPGLGGSGGLPGNGTGDTAGVGITMDGTPPAESSGVLVMRTLSNREYDHMLADLLGDTTAPAESGHAPSRDTPNAVGYVAPGSVSDPQVEFYRQTADGVVDRALQALAAGRTAGKLVIPCQTPADSSAELTCATQLVASFGREAYRRPVAVSEQDTLLNVFSSVRALGLTFTESIGAMVKVMIQSPNFLYHWEIGPTAPTVGADGLAPLTPWQLASRLASLLWETMPDDTLLQAAQSGQLATPAQVAAQVTRMLADDRAANGLFSFHAQWLFNFGVQPRDLAEPLKKSSPLYTDSVATSIDAELARFVSSIYAGDGTLESLFTAPYTYVNHDLAALYGVPDPGTSFAKAVLDPTERGGILTQTAFLATLAHDGEDDPVFRGLSIYLKVLCGSISSPHSTLPPVASMAKGTTRQSYEAQGAADCASSCHTMFEPAGFAFEHYDGIGSYRTTDLGQPVDSTGSLVTPAGATITFQNAMDLSKQLAQSPEVRACMDRQWTRYILGRAESSAEAGSMSMAYQKAAAKPGFSLRELLVSLLQSKAFMYRQPSSGETL